MSIRKAHEIWMEQCEAASVIELRYGINAAIDYVVAEKLLNFASAASKHSEFARELPKFIAQVRRMFTHEDMRVHIARLEHGRNEKTDDASEEDELFHESPAAAAERDRQFTTIKELLTAAELGTS